MSRAKRISMALFDDELKTLINASAKIFPMTQEEIDNDLNPNNYEYGKVGRQIYMWKNNHWDYIIADDIEISWNDLEGKPSEYPSAPHQHSEEDILGLDKYSKTEVNTLLESKSGTDHTHSQLHTHGNKTALDKLVDTNSAESYDIALLDYVSDVFNGYAEGHKHINFALLESLTQADLDFWNNWKSYTDTGLATKVNTSTFTGHTGNSTIHVTQENKNEWSGKAEVVDIPTKVSQVENDVGFITENAIPDIPYVPTKLSEFENDPGYVTQSDLGNAGYGDMVKSVYDTNDNGIVDNAEKVNGFTVGVNVPAGAKFTDTIYTHPASHPYSMITGTPTNLSDFEKDINFNELYYTETEVNNLLAGKVNNAQVLTNVPSGAKFTDTIYTHPSSHPASIITQTASARFVTDTEKSNWNSKAEGNHNHNTLYEKKITIGNTKPTDGSLWFKEL